MLNTADNTDARAWIDSYLGALAQKRSARSRAAPRTGLIALLARHGNPQRRLCVVRVAGSKGKGSTALILEAILCRSGGCPGVFTSPHIEHWCERIRVAGRPIEAVEFAAVLAELAPDVAMLRARPETGLDFFEVCLATALVIFARRGLDVVILEAGIGAATDATAVVGADLAVLTTVEAEHLNIIGPALADVAREKAGVIAPGRTAIIGRLPPVAGNAVASRGQAACARLCWLGRDFEMARELGGLCYREAGYRLRVATTPALYWLADNVALAVAAARRMPGMTVDSRATISALNSLRLPGRLECLGTAPVLLADGAHTPASSALLARALTACEAAPCVLVVAFSVGHGPGALSPALWRQAHHVVVTQADPSRGRDAAAIAGEIQASGRIAAYVDTDPATALARAVELAGAAGLVCVTGSVHLVGRARRYARQAVGRTGAL